MIVRYAPGTSAADRAGARADAGTAAAGNLGLPRMALLEITDGESVDSTISQLDADPAIASAEPDLLLHTASVPNDPFFGQLWGLSNPGTGINGFAGALAGADIGATGAWDIERGSPRTVVAVMDTGAEMSHPDLAGEIWTNPGEIPGNGIDDDGNGFVDDVHGWDFLDTLNSDDSTPFAEDNDPTDLNGHGTHVSGTILATGDNGIGITGVAQRAALMPLRICNAYEDTCPTSDLIEAINYAAANGARVLNGSLNGSGLSADVRVALNAHPNILYVFAAGNGGTDGVGDSNDTGPQFPCNEDQAPGYTAGNLICVAATDQADQLAGFSNYGAASVDLGAPGTETLSTSARRLLFSDDFESGFNWTNEAGSTWARSSEAPLSTPGITDSPGGNYAPSRTNRVTSNPVQMPSGYGNCELDYFRAIALGSGDTFVIQALLNGSVLATSNTLTSADNSVRTGFIPLNSSFDPGGTLRIRLTLTSNASGQADGVHMDDFRLICRGSPSDGGYEFLQGTSMATPHVTGAAALLFAHDPDATPQQVRSLLLENTDPLPSLAAKTVTGGRLDIAAALSHEAANTTIASGPGPGEDGQTNNPQPTFGLSSTETAPTFECALDGSEETDFGPCSGAATETPPGPLSEGPHTLYVRTVDPRGNVETTPARRDFTVDMTPPDTSLDSHPAALTNSGSAGFTFSSEPGALFECRLDSTQEAAFAPCASPQSYIGLTDGHHTVEVRAVDLAGNRDPTPVSFDWTVDATAPQIILTGHPPVLSPLAGATFGFSSDDPAPLECRLDSGAQYAYGPCTSPKSYAALADGPHTLEVRASDTAGNTGHTTFDWTVDTIPPETAVDAGPAALTNSPTAAFSFSSDPGASFECRLDDGGFIPCTSPQTYQGLADGPHDFQVRATDPAGNLDPTPAATSFVLDSTPPETAFSRRPRAIVRTAARRAVVSVGLLSSEPGSTFLCKVDSGPLGPCEPSLRLQLGAGRHSVHARARDAAGNLDPTPAVARFRIKRH